MDFTNNQQFKDFTFVALAVLLANVFAVLMSSLAQLVAKTPWPQKLFLDLFQAPGMGLPSVVMQSQALFSPIMNVIYVTFLPLALHILALVVLWSMTWQWNMKARVVYFCMSLVPVFGPIATQTIMKSLGEMKD
ncbi:hypothetical protein KAR34_05515 [bacterium]|nr:hypothetical protein [bacterium]